jgi:hypothetical protein
MGRIISSSANDGGTFGKQAMRTVPNSLYKAKKAKSSMPSIKKPTSLKGLGLKRKY